MFLQINILIRINNNMLTIKNILEKLDKNFTEERYSGLANGYIGFKGTPEQLKKFLQDELTLMLNGIENETLDKMEQLMVYAKDNREDYETVNEAHFATAQLKEVINIINSHR